MATTREEMLEAGVRLYGARSTGLLRGLTAGALAERAGFHRQTFYRHWETQSEYVQDLVRWLLDPGRGPAADGAEVLPRRHDAPADLEAFVHDLARHDLDRLLSEETVRMRFGLLMTEVLREPPFPEILQAYYESTMGRLAAAYDALLGTWGLELLDGVTSRDVARMIQAQLIGFAVLATSVQVDPPSTLLFERSTVILLRGLSRPRPADGPMAVPPERDQTPGGAPSPPGAASAKADTRQRFLEAGVRLYSELARDLLRGLTAGRVAKEAGLHRQTFYRCWKSHDAYIDELLRWLLVPGRGPRAAGVEELRRQRSVAPDLEAYVGDLARHDLANLLEDGYSRMRLGLALTGTIDGSMAPLSQAYYEDAIARIAHTLGPLLDRWGLEAVDDESLASSANVLQAQLIGSMILVKAVPDDDPPVSDLLERALLTVLGSLTRPRSSVEAPGGPGA